MQQSEVETKCHISRGPLCVYKRLEEMPIEFHKAYLAYKRMTSYAAYLDNSECVKKTINYQYWTSVNITQNAEEDEGTRAGIIVFLTIAVIAVAILLVVVIVVYFKREAKKEEDEPVALETDK